MLADIETWESRHRLRLGFKRYSAVGSANRFGRMTADRVENAIGNSNFAAKGFEQVSPRMVWRYAAIGDDFTCEIPQAVLDAAPDATHFSPRGSVQKEIAVIRSFNEADKTAFDQVIVYNDLADLFVLHRSGFWRDRNNRHAVCLPDILFSKLNQFPDASPCVSAKPRNPSLGGDRFGMLASVFVGRASQEDGVGFLQCEALRTRLGRPGASEPDPLGGVR